MGRHKLLLVLMLWSRIDWAMLLLLLLLRDVLLLLDGSLVGHMLLLLMLRMVEGLWLRLGRVHVGTTRCVGYWPCGHGGWARLRERALERVRRTGCRMTEGWMPRGKGVGEQDRLRTIEKGEEGWK